MSTAPLITSTAIRVLVEGLDHPEGVATGPDGAIYAGGEAGQIYRVSLEGELELIGTTGGFVLGLAVSGDRTIYACDWGHQAIVAMTSDGTWRVYADGDGTTRMRVPNACVFAADGTLYVSDSGSPGVGNGCLWIVRRGGHASVLREDVRAFPNGVAISPDGCWLHVALSDAQQTVRLALREDGSCDPPEVVVELPDHLPDGLAFDAQGRLYIACYAPNAILRLESGGALTTVAHDWTGLKLAAPTNITFAGDDLRTIVTAGLNRWHLAALPGDAPGMPLRYPSNPSRGVHHD